LIGVIEKFNNLFLYIHINIFVFDPFFNDLLIIFSFF